MKDPEQWLAENAIDCRRFGARLTQDACSRYRRENPERCKGCERVGEAGQVEVPAPKKRPSGRLLPLRYGQEQRQEGLKVDKAKKNRSKSGKVIRPCADCGRSLPITGRDRCGKCYRIMRKAEACPQVVPPADNPPALDELIAEPEEFIPPPRVVTAVEVMGDSEPAPAAPSQTSPAFAEGLEAVLAQIRETLLAKNAAYGNSALNPVRVFSKADPVEQIRVRIDDKISRLMRGQGAGEDTELDLVGYLVILLMARRG